MRNNLYAASLILAPLCYAVSSFFWQSDGQYTAYSVTAGTLLIVGSVFWVLAFTALFDLLKDRHPRYAAWGLMVAIYGCLCGGVGFALRDIITLLLHIPHKQILEAFAQYPIFENIVFSVGGPAFPMSLLVVGIVLTATKKVPLWIGVLMGLSGVLFPVSRIMRIEMIAHATDVCMLVPMVYLGWQLITNKLVISNDREKS